VNVAGVQVFGHQGCPRCSQVQAFIAAHGIPVQPHYLLTDPLDPKACARLLAQGVDETIVDSEAVAQAGLSMAEPDIPELAAWLAIHPKALRAPVIVRGDLVLAGSEAQQLDCMLY
jgi:arsenate reductase-like glutaredoxin family protein